MTDKTLSDKLKTHIQLPCLLNFSFPGPTHLFPLRIGLTEVSIVHVVLAVCSEIVFVDLFRRDKAVMPL